MIRRITVIFIILSLCLSFSLPVIACDEEQTNYYVTRILFGDKAEQYTNNDYVKMLTSALYICSEQSDKVGQEKLTFLEKNRVNNVPAIEEVNIKSSAIFENAHQEWEKKSSSNQKKQNTRRDVLRETVKEVFDFGWFNETFRAEHGQVDSFSALLYYSHILADYLADDPIDTAISANGYDIPAYSGATFKTLNGNEPSFTKEQKKSTTSYVKLSELDELGRAGVATANLSDETLAPPNSRQSIGNIKPSGWNQEKYPGIVNSQPPYLYNRCHLIAHQLANNDSENNLITGTRYLNEAMIPYENKVSEYIEETGNHVLYRATPVYVGNNAVASGVQLEAYSVEDKGKGVKFNVYLYNVQPGVDINYVNGGNTQEDVTSENEKMIPFRTDNPSESNPDLMYEIQRQLEILFEGQKESKEYDAMMKELDSIADEARNVGGTKDWEVYKKLKPIQYKYMEALSTHVPKLLAKEDFFTATFK